MSAARSEEASSMSGFAQTGVALDPARLQGPHAHEPVGALWGFWWFLMSDAIVFALLFATYGLMLPGTAGGPSPGQVYHLGDAFLETMLLLASSFGFGMASLELQLPPSGQQSPAARAPRRLYAWLLLTLLLGLGFVGMELHDFAGMVAAGAGPGRSGYLSSFFLLVATHGLHVFSGCVWLVVMLVQLAVFGLDVRVRLNLSRLALFWHFLDVVWIGIFSVVYLQGLIR